MGLRELKNQILYEIKKIKEFSSEIKEIEPSEIAETESEKDMPEIFEHSQKIELAKDVKKEIIPQETIETKLEKSEPESLESDKKIEFAKDVKQVLKDIVHHLEPEYSQQKADTLKDASRLFNKFDVKRVSVKSTKEAFSKNKIPTGLKSKFGVIREYSEEDKPKEGFLYQPKVEKSLESIIKKDVFSIKGDKKEDRKINEKGESKNNSESQTDEKENTSPQM